ncbi:MAG: hypothetical protein HN377_11585 [Alphaproteobacteria bacterium]|nr:hypothetical protein [Alphaproteobacteria bacterium]
MKAAQRSRFCMRSATIELFRGHIGAVLVGFGGMLAGGGITDYLVDCRPEAPVVEGFSVEETIPAR